MSETAGLVKLLTGMEGKLLGGHILSVRGDDLLAPLVLAMHANLSLEQLASALMPYPTLSEAVSGAAGSL